MSDQFDPKISYGELCLRRSISIYNNLIKLDKNQFFLPDDFNLKIIHEGIWQIQQKGLPGLSYFDSKRELVPDWFYYLYKGITFHVISLETLEHFLTSQIEENDEVSNWFRLKWICKLYGQPLTLLIKDFDPDSSSFTKTFKKISEHYENLNFWQAVYYMYLKDSDAWSYDDAVKNLVDRNLVDKI